MRAAIVISARVQAVFLFMMSAYLLLLLLASGHKVDFGDYKQLRLIFELFIFGVAAFFLLVKIKKAINFSSSFMVCLLGVVQLSLIDILIEISAVEYGESKPFFLLLLFLVIFFNNAFLIYSQVKIRQEGNDLK